MNQATSAAGLGQELKYLLIALNVPRGLPFKKENFQLNIPIYAVKVNARHISNIQKTLKS